MAGPADPEGIPLSDPTAPIDPEQAARTLGRTLAAKHTTAPSTDGRVDLAVFASLVRATAEADDDVHPLPLARGGQGRPRRPSLPCAQHVHSERVTLEG